VTAVAQGKVKRFAGWLWRTPFARIVHFAVLLIALSMLAGGIGIAMRIPSNSLKTMDANLASTVLTVLPYVLAYWALARLIEHRKLDDLSWRKSPQLLWGMLGGLALFALLTAQLWAAGVYRITGYGDASLWALFLLTAVVPGITEEIVCRGVLFRLTEEGLGTWIALLVSALFFGFAHASNPGATAWSSVAISIEAGLLFGLLYHVTRSLWWCIGLHAGWNFVQGAVFGIPVSGICRDPTGWMAVVLAPKPRC
jgi:membrane protease YdiL (CAAX protease family)